MSDPSDDHTLNACLARVIRKEIDLCWNEQTKRNEIPYCHYGSMEWNPVHDANQMEEVEAWLRENKWEYISGWNSQFNRHWAELRKGVKAFWTNDPDKKRAFALAVYAMEQAQKGTT